MVPPGSVALAIVVCHHSEKEWNAVRDRAGSTFEGPAGLNRSARDAEDRPLFRARTEGNRLSG